MPNRIRSQSRYQRLLPALLLGGLALLAWWGGTPLRAARLQTGTGTDPRLEALTLTAEGLIISDTLPGDAVTKTVYFNNGQSGILTWTLTLTGTAPLTLTPGAAFGQTPPESSSPTAPWTPVVTYSVGTADGDEAATCTVVNADSVPVSITLFFRQDITAPVATFATPAGVVTGANVLISGTAADNAGGSGVRRVQVSTGTTWSTATGTTAWSYLWSLPVADFVAYTLTARAEDFVGAEQSPAATRVITVDTVAPAAPTPQAGGPWVPTSTLVFTWAEPADGAGIAGYYVVLTTTGGPVVNDSFTAGPAFTYQGSTEGVTYYARIKAQDRSGNIGPYGGTSAGVTPDLTPPSILTPFLQASPPYFYVAGLTLFYTNTMLAPETFNVRGNATDGGSGMQKVTFSPAFGQTPPEDVTLPAFQGAYDVSAGATESGHITATAYDRVGHTAVQVYTYTLDGLPPTSQPVAPAYARSSPIAVTWVATDTGSGVYSTTLWYRKEDAGAWTADQTRLQAAGTFSFTPTAGDGLYAFTTVAADYLGNGEPGPTVSKTHTIYDTISPTVVLTAPAQSTTTVFTLSWLAQDATSGPDYYQVDYFTGTWQTWIPVTTTTFATFTAPLSNTTYTFRVTAYDRAGNWAAAEKRTSVGWNRIYLPLVLRTYRALSNGDFGTGNLLGWDSGRGPFNVPNVGWRGGGLPQNVINFEGNYRGLLGQTSGADGSLPVGYGTLAQSFVVEKRYLNLTYRVITLDRIKNELRQRYFDTFEVSLNRSPTDIGDSERDNQGCNDSARVNPTGVVTGVTGLVFCGGRVSPTPVSGTLWDSGWRTVRLDLGAFQGQLITLHLTLWSREYDAPFYDNRGYYNTYVYLDDVTLTD